MIERIANYIDNKTGLIIIKYLTVDDKYLIDNLLKDCYLLLKNKIFVGQIDYTYKIDLSNFSNSVIIINNCDNNSYWVNECCKNYNITVIIIGNIFQPNHEIHSCNYILYLNNGKLSEIKNRFDSIIKYDLTFYLRVKKLNKILN